MAIPMAATVFFFSNPSPRFPPKLLLLGSPRSRTLPLSLGFDRRRRRIGRGGEVLETSRRKEEEDAFSALEEEVLDFMEGSENPNAFPTKDALVKAGRTDLAEAIASSGGWLAFGWDSKDPISSSSSSSSSPEEEEGIEEEASPSSCTGGSMEKDGGEEAGIEGILSRLEKERSLSFGVGDKSQGEVRGEVPSGEVKIARGDAVGGIGKSYVSTSSDFGSSRQSGQVCSWKGTAEHVNVNNSAPHMWRTWSLERAGNPVTEFEAAEIVPDEEKIKSNIDSTSDDSLKEKSKEAQSVSKVGDRRRCCSYGAKENGQNQLQVRLEHLESELSSTLDLLRSGAICGICHKGQDSSLEELQRLSDAWEFKETEIMRSRDKLRSTRAKLAVLEGKMALEIIEAQKIMGENRKRFHAAKKALHLLRSVCIVWPNSASEVLLAGSFDGWTSQRRMERSKTGIFSLTLKLYPGRYEIKFIVDGEWRIDPLRPVVHNNGHQNNLLILS